MGTIRALGTAVALRTRSAGLSRVALRSVCTGLAIIPALTPVAVRTPAILHVAGAVLIHVLGGQVTLAILVQIPAVQAVRALWAALTLGPLCTGIALRALRAHGARGTLGTRLAGVALRPRRAVIPAVTLGALNAAVTSVTSAIPRVAGAVVI